MIATATMHQEIIFACLSDNVLYFSMLISKISHLIKSPENAPGLVFMLADNGCIYKIFYSHLKKVHVKKAVVMKIQVRIPPEGDLGKNFFPY
jgi:hypothetical protein